MFNDRRSGVVGGEKFAGGESPFHKGMHRFDVLDPFRPAAPELVEGDGRAGSILNFRQVRHV